MTSLPKTLKKMEKCGTCQNQTKYISFERFQRVLFKNVIFIEFGHCVKSYWHLCQIYQEHSSNIIMSHDPGFKLSNSILNLGKVTKFG